MSRLDAGVLQEATTPAAASVERPSGRAPAWWGMVLFVATEATLFATLLASYFYLRFTSPGPWPLGGIEDPKLVKPLIMTGILLSSSGPMVWADRAVRQGRVGQVQVGLALTWLLGVGFLALQATEYAEKLAKFTWTTNAYGSVFYTITGFHGLHVAVGLLMVGFTLVAALAGKFTPRHHERVALVALYWHFIDVVWIAILSAIYLSPHL